ncbi:hypothetical protein GCM10027072_26000 [Streptomyces bullii]
MTPLRSSRCDTAAWWPVTPLGGGLLKPHVNRLVNSPSDGPSAQVSGVVQQADAWFGPAP